jgi:hypothetical protein
MAASAFRILRALSAAEISGDSPASRQAALELAA